MVYFLWNFLLEMLDIEKLTFFLFCGNKRRLQRAGKQLVWLLNVTLPFYVSFWILFAYLIQTTKTTFLADTFDQQPALSTTDEFLAEASFDDLGEFMKTYRK